MNKQSFRGSISVFIMVVVLLLPRPAMAYIGPGTGLTAIGAFLAVILGVIVALFGFVWYPIKRLLRRKPSKQDVQETP